MGLPRQATAGLASQSRLENGLCREYADVFVKHLSPQQCHLMAEFSLTLASYEMPSIKEEKTCVELIRRASLLERITHVANTGQGSSVLVGPPEAKDKSIHSGEAGF